MATEAAVPWMAWCMCSAGVGVSYLHPLSVLLGMAAMAAYQGGAVGATARAVLPTSLYVPLAMAVVMGRTVARLGYRSAKQRLNTWLNGGGKLDSTAALQPRTQSPEAHKPAVTTMARPRPMASAYSFAAATATQGSS